MTQTVLVVEGRSKATNQAYDKNGWKTWGKKWSDLLSTRYKLQVQVVHHLDLLKTHLDDKQLVVFGGSGMNVYAQTEDAAHYINVMSRVLDKNIPIIGSCFGLQAMGHIFGVTVRRMTEREFGVIDVIPHKGKLDVSAYKACASHNDCLGWNVDSVFNVVANSLCCPQVIYGIHGSRQPFLGLQHHPEWNTSDLRHIAAVSGREYTDDTKADLLTNSRYMFIDTFINQCVSEVEVK